MQRIALIFLLFSTGILCSLPCSAGIPACVTDTSLLQVATSTPARVTGVSGEQVVLHMYHPQSPIMREPPVPDMYLLTGDAVEVIATCEKYAYVRYQGHKVVSTGWVEKARLQNTGMPHERPKDTVGQVCAAAANIINRDGGDDSSSLPHLLLVSTPKGMEEKITKVNGDDMDPIRGFDGMARIVINGQALKVFPVEDGGTCPSSYLHIWSDDLSNPIANTSAGRQFGDGQEMVQVLGHPLVLKINYSDRTAFSLSSLDKNGQLNLLCVANRVYMPLPHEASDSTDPVCKAAVTNHVTAIPSKDEGGSHISLPSGTDTKYESAFTLRMSKADLLNEGKARDIGLVAFHYESGAACGSTVDSTFPVILNARGGADLADATNKRLIKEVTGADDNLNEHTLGFPAGGSLITYAGSTYFVMYADQPASNVVAGVLRFTATGSQSVCDFQPHRFEVVPAVALDKQIAP